LETINDDDAQNTHQVAHKLSRGVGLVIERLLIRLPAGALSSQLGQLSHPSVRGR